MSNRESGNRVSRAEMDVTEISPRKPFGFPGEEGMRRSSREEEQSEEGRRRVGEEEEEDDEDEDRLDVVGLDEGISSRPGTPFLSPKPVTRCRLTFTTVSVCHPSQSQYQCVHVSMRCPRSGIGVSIPLLELISRISDRGRFHQRHSGLLWQLSPAKAFACFPPFNLKKVNFVCF